MNTNMASTIEPTAEHSVIMSTVDLRTMLVDLAESASTDETIAAVNGVLLHTDTSRERPLLVGTSTDRFVVAQAHIEVLSGEYLPETFIERADLGQLLTALAPLDNTDTHTAAGDGDKDGNSGEGPGAGPREGTVRLVRTGATLTLHHHHVDRDQGDRDQVDHPVVRVDIRNREFPAIRRPFLPRPGAQQTTQLAPHHLRMFAQIAARRGAPAVALTLQRDQARVQVSIGDRYQAVVATVRDQPTPDPAVSIPPRERARETRLGTASWP